jgi:hypothetical protein
MLIKQFPPTPSTPAATTIETPASSKLLNTSTKPLTAPTMPSKKPPEQPNTSFDHTFSVTTMNIEDIATVLKKFTVSSSPVVSLHKNRRKEV